MVNRVKMLPWPAKSPDKKPFEDIWAHMVLDAYKNFKQYDSERELLEGIRKAWAENHRSKM